MRGSGRRRRRNLGAVRRNLQSRYTQQQDYAAFVERCLKEKGYETEGVAIMIGFDQHAVGSVVKT